MAVILLLEDEESVNRGITFIFEKEGYEVISCRTIHEARAAWQTRTPDMLLCDLNLPDGNGLDFVKEVRQKSNTYIICLTAQDGEMDYVAGYGAGADDYVAKPFRMSVLLLKVRAHFDRREKKESKKLRSGDICVDEERMKAMKKDTELMLTPNEWRLLLMFLHHPNRILSKRQILEQLFDLEGNFVDENTIAVNIRRLREKIEPDVSKPSYIKNVRGAGYIWTRDCNAD